MVFYSALLGAVLVVGTPWWLMRMLTSARYRAGLTQRLGRVPAGLRAAGAAGSVVWIHAVSVGEVLAAVRLIEELRRLRPGLGFAVSTTTAAGQELARQRLGRAAVFHVPLDLGWIVRRYLRALQPVMLALMESELWPNLIVECARQGVPVAVANARISDRSYPRYLRLRRWWRPVLGRVSIFLAQSEETAERLRAILGEQTAQVEVTGNIKYDARVAGQNAMAERLREGAQGRPMVVAGSTVEAEGRAEEELVMQAMARVWETLPEALLVLAPRHPQRFAAVAARFEAVRATELDGAAGRVVVLDTIGDLAAVYGVVDAAFVGGSLVRAGGHNPLEAAQFGVPVVMGESVENFRAIVETMAQADGIRLVKDAGELGEALLGLLSDRSAARAAGERGRRVFEAQAGATARTAAALLKLLPDEVGR